MASDALHVIQDLQVKLRRTSQEVQRQKENVAEAEAALRHQAQRHEAARALHEETFRRLQVAFQERDAECATTEHMSRQLAAAHGELQRQEHRRHAERVAFVSREVHAAAEAELKFLQDEVEKAMERKVVLERSLEEMKEAKVRRDELIRDKAAQESGKEQKEAISEAIRKGKALSSRAVAEEQARAVRAQRSGARQLLKEKESIEAQLEETYKQSASIEERLEGLREQNRRAESQLIRNKEQFEKERKQKLSEMRKQSAAFRTFASLLEEGCLDHQSPER
ncbi:Uncharacterized protein SCF082_LOCUS32509 [Durusdinium trenchii]